jgi:hypothetical protein
MARAHAQAYERGREDAARPTMGERTRPAESTDPMGTRMDPAADPAADVRKS